MNKTKFEQSLANLTGSEGSYPFGPEALVFKVMGKMFALVPQRDEAPSVTLKIAPANGEVLVSLFEAVKPGYHMNKRHWITIALNGDMAEEMILDLANGSYDLVVKKLTKAERLKLEPH